MYAEENQLLIERLLIFQGYRLDSVSIKTSGILPMVSSGFWTRP